MDLTNDDIMHVAHLARIDIPFEELELYREQLNDILSEMKRINEVDIKSNELLISPSDNKNVYREDVGESTNSDILFNAPKTNGNYIEVKRFLNE